MTGASRAAVGGGVAGGVIHSLPAAAALVSLDGSVIEYNGEAAELFGWGGGMEPRLVGTGARWFRWLCREVEALERAEAVITRRRGGRRIAVEVRASRAGAGALLLIFRDCTGQLNARRARVLGERRL
ncbi:MAG TPA: hypothetical protein VK928_03575, partial [Longimicrobiales bacterium]|nr:hypothetical protein [Longimicrobiales bacterium]